MKLCPKCAYVFTCRYANTDVANCDKYEHSNLSDEDFKKQIDNIKNGKEILEE